MGRFDILKENTFTSSNMNSNRGSSRNSNRDSNRNSSSNRDSNRDNNRNSSRNRDSNKSFSNNNLFKQKEKQKEYNIEENAELFPELVIQNVKQKIDMDTQWLEIAEKEAEHDIKHNNINIDSDPKYWKNSQWIGNMLIREKKSNDICVNNLNEKINEYSVLEKKSNKQITSSRIEYSRDGEKWYNNWDATFSKKQLEAMNDENNNKMINRWSNWIEIDYEKRRLESEEHYNDTGEVDNFMIAEQEKIEYEEYEKQIDCDDESLYDDESSEEELI